MVLMCENVRNIRTWKRGKIRAYRVSENTLSNETH